MTQYVRVRILKNVIKTKRSFIVIHKTLRKYLARYQTCQHVAWLLDLSNYHQFILADGATTMFVPLSKDLYIIADSALCRLQIYALKCSNNNDDFLSHYWRWMITLTLGYLVLIAAWHMNVHCLFNSHLNDAYKWWYNTSLMHRISILYTTCVARLPSCYLYGRHERVGFLRST